jgi:hypothetical protein
MTHPTPYVPTTGFASWQVSHPNVVFNGVDLDGEFNALKVTTDQTIRNLKLIQRADGALGDKVVGVDQLATAVLNLIGMYQPKGNWTTTFAYKVRDVVTNGGVTYLCAADHTAGTFATDLAAGKWVALTQDTSIGAIAAGSVSVTPAGAIASSDVQAALVELDAEKQPLAANLTAFAGLAGAANKLPFFSGVSNLSLADFSAIGQAFVAAVDAAAVRAIIGAVTGPTSPPANSLAFWDSGTSTLKAALAGGTVGHVLTATGSGNLPSYQAITFPPSVGEVNTLEVVGIGVSPVLAKVGAALRVRGFKTGAITFTRTSGDPGQPIIGLSTASITPSLNGSDSIVFDIAVNYQTAAAPP